MILIEPPKKRPRQLPFRKGEAGLKYQYDRDEALARIQLEEALAALKRAEAANNSSFDRQANAVMSAMTQLARETPFTGLEYVQAAEDLRLKKVEKWHDINKGFEAAIMALLGTDLAVPFIKGGINWLRNKAVSPATRLMMNPENFIFEGPKIKPAQINLLPEMSPEETFAMRFVEPLLKKPQLELPQPKLTLGLPVYNARTKLSIPEQDAGLYDITDGDLFGIKLADSALKRPITVTPQDFPSGLFENLTGNSAKNAANNLYKIYTQNLPLWQYYGVRPPLPYITSVGDESLSVGFRPLWYSMIDRPLNLERMTNFAGPTRDKLIKSLSPEAKLAEESRRAAPVDLFDMWLGPEARSSRQIAIDNELNTFNSKVDNRLLFDTNVNNLYTNGLITPRHRHSLLNSDEPLKYFGNAVQHNIIKKSVQKYFKDIKLAKQKDYARRVMKARDLEDRLNVGLNDRANAVYSDLLGSIKPLLSLNSQINDANQTVGLIRSIGDIVEDTFNNYQAWKVDPNREGWQLKYLMRGNKLEQQLSKDGNISINAINDLVKNGSDIEKYVTKKVLDEKFAGQSKINYADFKHAVQDELVTYRTQQNHSWESYGMDRIGYTSWEDGEHVKLDTYTFSTPKIPKGNMQHYQTNTLGHSRTFVSEEEPDVMHVMESLSDWGLKGRNTGHYETDMYPYGSETDPLTPHEKYLMKNWESRLIKENLIHAADKGLTKMRYPTKETAAKIEGYSREGGGYWESSYRAERGDTPYTDRLIDLDHQLKSKELLLSETTGQSDIERLQKEIDKIKRNIDRVEAIEERFKAGEITYNPDQETILDKYKLFPKVFKKIYKNAEVREVTDAKGNTWYEVDVPKDMRKREHAYSIVGTAIAGGTAAATLKPLNKNDKK